MRLPDLPWWKRNFDARNPVAVPWHFEPFLEGDEREQLVRHALALLIAEAYRNAVDRGWWHGKSASTHFCEKLVLIHAELSEALEAFRRGRWSATPRPATEEESEKRGVSSVVTEGAIEEIGDVAIRLFDLIGAIQAAMPHVDFTGALLAKMAKNRQHDGSDTGKAF